MILRFLSQLRRGMVVGGGLSVVLIGGCSASNARPAYAQSTGQADWRRTATDADRLRLRQWRTVWLDALSRARGAGAGREIAAQGRLFEPDRFLSDPLPPSGAYQCGVFKLGAKRAGARDYIASSGHSCRVDGQGGAAEFHMSGGAQQLAGRIFPGAGGRGVLLGTLMLEGERHALRYGRDATRDMAGFVDRIDDRRWRIVLPLPPFGSTLEVIEMVPAS